MSEVSEVNPKWSLYFYETYICYRVCIYFTWYIVPVVQNNSLMGLKFGEVGDLGTQIPKSP